MNEQNNDNLSARAKVVAATQGEIPRDEIAPQKERRIANFFYHRKRLVAVIAFVVVLAAFSLWSFFSTGGSSDITVMYAGPCELYADTGGSLASAIRSVRTSEGNESVALADIAWYSPEDMEALEGAYTLDEAENAKALAEFREELTYGDTVFLMLSPQLYEEVRESLVPLAEIFGEIPASAADDRSVRLGDTDFYKFFTAAQVLPEDTRICIRRAADMDAYSEERAAETDGLCRALLRDIAGFVSPISSEETQTG